MLPKISIVTPNYNGEKYLEECILSIINQNYPNIEYIIIDGGSTDNSLEIIKKYEQHINYWVSEKDNGQSEAINKGLELATGDVVNWLCSDDFLTKDALQHIGTAFTNKKVNIVAGSCEYIDINSNRIMYFDATKINKQTLFSFWKSFSSPPQPSIYYRKELLEQVGFLDESLHFAMDYDLWLKFATANYQFSCIPNQISTYRYYLGAKTYTFPEKSKKEQLMVFHKYFKQLPLSLKLKIVHQYAINHSYNKLEYIANFFRLIMNQNNV